MREIDLDVPDDKLPVNTFLCYGDSRNGKTTWAASLPRPLFLADATEQGWESVKNIEDAWLFEPHVKPRVWAIEKAGDLALAVQKARPLIQSRQVLSVVIDSISFYADLYLAFLLSQQTKRDSRAAYGELGNHLRHIRVELHGLACNVAWLALAKHPETPDDGPAISGGPLIPGQQADKLCAGVHYIFYRRREKDVFEMRTKPWRNYLAGNRLAANTTQLPDPLIGTYADFLVALGYDPEALRKTLPAYVKQPRLVPDVKPATPPVVNVAKPIVKPIVTNARPPLVIRPVVK